jgi:hypothetical protein
MPCAAAVWLCEYINVHFVDLIWIAIDGIWQMPVYRMLNICIDTWHLANAILHIAYIALANA